MKCSLIGWVAFLSGIWLGADFHQFKYGLEACEEVRQSHQVCKLTPIEK